MAELNVTVKIKGDDALKELGEKISKIQEAAKDIKINFKDANTALKAVQDIEKAQKKLEEMAEKRLNLEKQYQTQLAKTVSAAARITAEEEKTAREKEKTRQVELKLSAETEKRMAKEATANAKIVDGQRKLQQELSKTERHVSSLGNTWKSMFSAFTLSSIATRSVNMAMMKIRQAFRDALNEMKELDTALTHYRQVTGASSAQAATIGSQAYSVGSKYGTSAADYAESVATYARAGYRETADELAELSLKTVIVGQTTQEIADQFLLTMDAAYGYKGSVEELSRVLDGASAIDSNYATTIEKIAAGLGLVAPLANQVHVSEEQLTAAIGTITAVTQRSGAESARALRSLFLNILKDTTTEIEEGVTATEESVADMEVLLNKYAKSAVKAAEASGEVINPMEAIGALAESMKEGFLTEKELMDMMSSLGGKLRVSQLVALVSNWDMYNEMIQTYNESMGSADQKTTTYLDSWEAKVNILKNTWTEFVAKTINTDMVKGFVSGLTKVIQLVGNLGNAIKIIVGTVAGIKIAKKASELWGVANSLKTLAQAAAMTKTQMLAESVALNQSGKAAEAKTASDIALVAQERQLEAQTRATAAAQSALAFTIATAAVSAIAIAINAYNAYYQKQMQLAEESRDKAIETARAEQEKNTEVSAAYELYVNAKRQLDDTAQSAENYKAAVDKLAEALGIENGALLEQLGLLDQMVEVQGKRTVQETEKALQEAINTARTGLGKFSLPKWGATMLEYQQYNIPTTGYQQHVPLLAELESASTVDDAVKAYEKLVRLKDVYLERSKGESESAYLYTAALNTLNKELSDYSSFLDPVIELQGQLNKLQEEGSEAPAEMSAEEMAAALGTEADAADEAAKAFGNLRSAIKDAKDALEDYKKATQTEKDTAYTQYADAWKAAYEDIQKGLKNSNAVNAALDLFFTPEQIMRMHERGLEAADIISDDFWSGIFTYINDKGETAFINDDAGANFIWAIYDKFADEAGEIKDANGEVVASFQEVDGELSVQVDSFEALAKALGEVHDTSVDPDVLAAVFEALGMYSQQIQESPEDIKAIAEGLNAVNEAGEIDLEKLIQGQIDEGKTTEAIMDLYEAILKMHEEEGNPVKIAVEEDGSLEDVKKTVEELIKKRDEISKEPAELVTTVEDEASKPLQGIKDLVIWLKDNNVIETAVEAFTNPAETALSAVKSLLETIFSYDGKSVDISVNTRPASIITEDSAIRPQSLFESANGQENFIGGLSLINEKGAELIVEDGIARIAGHGQPTLTYLQQGADVYTASETKAILGNVDQRNLYDGIGAYADADHIRRYQPKDAKDTSTSDTETTTTQGTTTTQPKDKGKTDTTSDKDEELEKLKKIVELRKSELSLIEAEGKSTKKQIQKEREIYDALGKQIAYMKEHKYSQTEINKLLTEQYKIQEEINKLNKELYDDLSKAVQARIDKNNKARDKEKKEIQDQIDAKKKEHDLNKENLELEEKELAVQEAKDKLAKAKAQRTVRYYNAKTGQWEWKANAQDVESARKEYTEAKQNLSDYKSEKAYEAEIAKLERKQEKIDAKYDKRNDLLQQIIDSLEEPVISISKALKNIEKNATKDQKSTIDSLNAVIVKVLGKKYKISTKGLYDSGGVLQGIGGIKGTQEDEVVLPPDITKSMLKPISTAVLTNRLNELRYLYGTTGGMAGITNSNSIGTQYNGNQYTFGNITLTEGQARSTTIYDLVQKSRGLRAYNAM